MPDETPDAALIREARDYANRRSTRWVEGQLYHKLADALAASSEREAKLVTRLRSLQIEPDLSDPDGAWPYFPSV